ncbi:hypothetical protein SO802_012683 [Lithocarpus litseifolius]|uniref:Uncharacterized protein n=1 Tax=Lithocarpus litseifolius TaxID=425828 RepID=A0AAW2D3F8_9ROSI
MGRGDRRLIFGRCWLLWIYGSKQETSTQHQGKLQVSATQRASQQQGVVQHAPQEQEMMQVNAGQSASQHQWKTRDAIISNEELEDFIESIPYHDQIIHSIQGMMPHGLEVTS